jgi:hypothetical protein
MQDGAYHDVLHALTSWQRGCGCCTAADLPRQLPQLLLVLLLAHPAIC